MFAEKNITINRREANMLVEVTVEKMMQMKLHKMATSFKERLSRSDHQELSQSEFMGFLVDDEYQHRQNAKLESRLRCARFKEPDACIENIDHQFRRCLQKKTILDFAQNEWIKKHQNIICTGPSGIGKGYVTQALANHACRAGYSILFVRATIMYSQLQTARADGTYLRKLKTFSKCDVLLIDDFGMSPLDDLSKQDLFEIIEDRHQMKSIIITSQLPTENWHEYLGGGMLGDAICDRLLHQSHRIKLVGESYRKAKEILT